jgi:hypothetical protein
VPQKHERLKNEPILNGQGDIWRVFDINGMNAMTGTGMAFPLSPGF